MRITCFADKEIREYCDKDCDVCTFGAKQARGGGIICPELHKKCRPIEASQLCADCIFKPKEINQ